MLLASLDRRVATMIRLLGLALVAFSILGASSHRPGSTGRGLVVSLLFAAAVIAWLVWTIRPDRPGITPELYVMAAAGGLLVDASPRSAASAFVFVAVLVAGLRAELSRSGAVALTGTIAVALSDLLYNGNPVGLIAFALGFWACLLAASNARERAVRAEQAELLLAQTQRSNEEQVRSARLQESTRIAREIHDVLAHTLAGLMIQLEATTALIEQDADRDSVLARVTRAHQLAREGLQETRRAVGALRGDAVSAPERIESLITEYRDGMGAEAQLVIDGDQTRLSGSIGEAVLRIVQEALTNVRKHAPGARVSVVIHAGEAPGDDVSVVVDDWPGSAARGARFSTASGGLAESGGGYGLMGMRERAEMLGGTLRAGRRENGWCVELRLPAPAARREDSR